MILQVRNHSGMQWAIQGPGKFSPCGRTVQELPAGAYSCLVDYCGNTHFELRDLQVDDLIDFPDSMTAHVLDEIKRFWNQGDPASHGSASSIGAATCSMASRAAASRR